jgi:hypothetical protein
MLARILFKSLRYDDISRQPQFCLSHLDVSDISGSRGSLLAPMFLVRSPPNDNSKPWMCSRPRMTSCYITVMKYI